MSIGTNISELRREMGLTQQQLAEKLGVSGQSVSKWENDVCAPDVAQFPQLAELFGVSIDRLYGFRLADGEEARALIDRADKCETLEENIAMLKAGLEKYPNSPELKTALATSWLSLSLVRDHEEKREEAEKAREACIRLCRELIRSCGDRQRVDEAFDVLRRAYVYAGEYERALDCIERLSPEAWQLRIVGKAQVLMQRGDKELMRFGQRQIFTLWLTMDSLLMMMVSVYYSQDARRALAFSEVREKLLSLFDLVCPDFYAPRKFMAADTWAKLQRALEDKEGCLAALRRQMALGLQCKAAAKLEDHHLATRNWIFFDQLKEDPEMQEDWMPIPNLPAHLEKYEGFLGDDEGFRSLKAEMEMKEKSGSGTALRA